MYAGKNLKALLGELGYSVTRFVAALGGTIPQARIESWIKGMGAPKVPDTKILCDFFKITSEEFHTHLFTEEEIKMIVKNRSISVKAKEINHSTINQTFNDANEVIYLKDKIAMLEAQLKDKERTIEILIEKNKPTQP